MKKQDPLIGTTIKNEYEIVQKIGAGGMAKVYKARQKSLNRYVALKIVNEDISEDPDLTSRFYREAEDLARLKHPNVVSVFECGNDSGVYYITMEYLEGQNLLQKVRQEGRLDQLSTIKYIAPLASALSHIHDFDLVHRDVKSSNIIITLNDQPVLMDFGIAMRTDRTIYDGSTVLGTAEYMSPEQTKGQALDERTDLYSLGVVMYECLTGKVPFHGNNLTVTLNMVANDDPVPPKEMNNTVSDWMNNLVLQLLAKDRNQRVANAMELAEILDKEIHTGSGGVAYKQANSRKTPKENKARATKQASQKKKNVPQSRKKKEEKIRSPKKVRLLIALSLLLILLFMVPVGLWYLGYLSPPGISNDTETPQEGLSPELLSRYTSLAKDSFSNANYVLAFRYYSIIQESSGNPDLQKENYLKSKEGLLQHLSAEIEMNSIPGGSFIMGDAEFSGDRAPGHEVLLSPFTISSKEITMHQYVGFLNSHRCSEDGYIKGIKVFDPKHLAFTSGQIVLNMVETQFVLDENSEIPAFGVTWEGARMFCEFLGGRLPTEAEWEYAARSASSFEYSGADNPKQVGWFSGNTNSLKTVGLLAPNAWNIYDMSGNVWEWCSDYYSRLYYKDSPTSNPPGPPEGEARVIRGGDFTSHKILLSSTYRSFMYDDAPTNDFIGFRMCK